ncbi:hypothetical protein B0H13DRAFT_2323071 [Mycena leptocephala]|nr:hypothetical protein B0H13DRAFT_2323071 [Mycena leptocephala]
MLGYTSAAAALAVFDPLDAPHLHTLALEDVADFSDCPRPPPHASSPPICTAALSCLANLALHCMHLAGPLPPVHVAGLELEAMDPSALAALELTTDTLCTRGSLAAPLHFPTHPLSRSRHPALPSAGEARPCGVVSDIPA